MNERERGDFTKKDGQACDVPGQSHFRCTVHGRIISSRGSEQAPRGQNGAPVSVYVPNPPPLFLFSVLSQRWDWNSALRCIPYSALCCNLLSLKLSFSPSILLFTLTILSAFNTLLSIVAIPIYQGSDTPNFSHSISGKSESPRILCSQLRRTTSKMGKKKAAGRR
jgi:hypothetical protein